MSDAFDALRREIEEMRRTGRTLAEGLLDLSLAHASPEVAQAMWYCAVPRWFNLEIIRELRPSQPSGLSDQTILDHLLQLPFVREYAPFGYVYEQATRRSLLERWRRDDPDSFVAWNRRAQQYFAQRLRTTTTSRMAGRAGRYVLSESDRSLFQRELMVHKLIVDPEAGFQSFQDLFRLAERSRQYSEMQALLSEVKSEAPYLSNYRRIYLDYYGGVLALHSGRPDDARRIFRGLLPLTGPSHLQSKLFYRMGELAVTDGQNQDAIMWYQRCLETCKLANCHPWETARVLRDLGSTYMSLSDWRQAESCYLRSLDEWQRLGDQLGVVETYNDLGTLYLKQHKSGKALKCYQQSLARLQNSPDQWRIARIYNNLGNYYFTQKQWEQALDYFRRSLEVKSRLSDTYGIGATNYNIANVYLSQGRDLGTTRPLPKKAEDIFRQAAMHFELSLRDFRLAGDRSIIAQTLYYLASTRRLLGEREIALRYIDEAMSLYRSLGGNEAIRAQELRQKIVASA